MRSVPRRHSCWLVLALAISFFPAGCFFFGHKKKTTNDLSSSAEPDKLLYDRALNDYKHGRYTESRLSLQTLINSYPDSEYLAKAKLAIADSYYKEGGTEALTEAVSEYKDFITFFPFLDEASYAQLQVAKAHFRMMEKPDRDATQARLAEQEFQTFLLKYPKSPLAPQAEQDLRDVQEVLAEGDFRVAHFYYIKGDYRASAARLIELTDRYPLYSRNDTALWTLGDIYLRVAHGVKNERDRAVWWARADQVYARLVREYPLSPLATEAKRRLTEAGIKIPPPDPAAVARMEYEKKFAHDRPGLFHRALGVIKSGPDVSMAAHSGEPDLNPPSDITASTDILRPGGTSNIGEGSSAPGGATGQNISVETVGPGTSGGVAPSASAGSGTTSASPAATGAGATAEPGASSNTDATVPASSAPASGSPASSTGTVAQSNSQAGKKGNDRKLNKKKESSSKKKKGLHKLIPW